MLFNPVKSENQKIELDLPGGVELFLKREDQIHPVVSGNKYRKLKYNIEEALNGGFTTLLSFGGAYSNHIAAVAFAAKSAGLMSIGIIRGEEIEDRVEDNPTLSFARSCGMKLVFVSRTEYREKSKDSYILNLVKRFGSFYHVPEGGTNALAVKGCEEILGEGDNHFDYICCAVGTGGTIAGIIRASAENQHILGFPALKAADLSDNISKFVQPKNWSLVTDYHFGGYAKINTELITFINEFKQDHGIPLDPVYTGKMMYGILDMIKRQHFPKDAKILAIHTGGLQGIAGMNQVLKQKDLPEII